MELAPPAQVHINDTETLVVARRLGTGLCQLPDNLVQDELASGELVEVLPGSRPEAMSINVVYRSGRRDDVSHLSAYGVRRLVETSS